MREQRDLGPPTVGPEHTGRAQEEQPDHHAGHDLGLDPLADRTLHRLRVRDEEPVLVRVFVHEPVSVGDPVTRYARPRDGRAHACSKPAIAVAVFAACSRSTPDDGGCSQRYELRVCTPASPRIRVNIAVVVRMTGGGGAFSSGEPKTPLSEHQNGGSTVPTRER